MRSIKSKKAKESKPKNYTQHMLGLHKEIWEWVDVERYLDEERKSWLPICL
ncbi:MAG: hypothetical protein ACRD5H_02460 [Nitrososphaerales archaeon]